MFLRNMRSVDAVLCLFKFVASALRQNNFTIVLEFINNNSKYFKFQFSRSNNCKFTGVYQQRFRWSGGSGCSFARFN